jgi:Protein of unknown function (DUF2523)
MQAILWPIVSWIFREILIKFAVLTGMMAVVVFLVPFAVNYLGGFVDSTSLSNAFNSLPGGLLWLLAYFRLDYGLPLLISAAVSRFLIRRLPVIG